MPLTAQAKHAKNQVEVNLISKGLLEEDLVFIAQFQNQAERKVTTGKNGGRSLRHVNVVREFKLQDNSLDIFSLQIPSESKSPIITSLLLYKMEKLAKSIRPPEPKLTQVR